MGAAGGGRLRGRGREQLTSKEREELRRLRQENAELQAGQRDPERGQRVFRDGARPDPAKVTRFIDSAASRFGVEPICRVLGVPVSTHYARRSRKPSSPRARDAELVAEIDARPGRLSAGLRVRKTWQELQRQGVAVGRDRVARLMRQRARGRPSRQEAAHHDPDEAAPERARDLFSATSGPTRPNEMWVADITYLRVPGRLRLSGLHPRLLQPRDRRLAARHPPAHRAVLDALEMADRAAPARRRACRPLRSRSAVHLVLHRPPRRARHRSQVGSRGDAYDNAMAEALVGDLQDRTDRRLRAHRSPASSTPNTRRCTGSASTTTNGCTKNSATCRRAVRHSAPAGPSRPAVQPHDGAVRPRTTTTRPMVESTSPSLHQTRGVHASLLVDQPLSLLVAAGRARSRLHNWRVGQQRPSAFLNDATGPRCRRAFQRRDAKWRSPRAKWRVGAGRSSGAALRGPVLGCTGPRRPARSQLPTWAAEGTTCARVARGR